MQYVLRVECEKCGRFGRYPLSCSRPRRLIVFEGWRGASVTYPRRRLDKRWRDLRILDWLGEPTADCPRKKCASVSDHSHALCSDLSKVV